VARFVLALAAVLFVAGCTSDSKQSSAETSASQSSAGTSSSAQASGSGETTGAAGATSTALPSAPSVAPNGAVSKTTYTDQGGVWPLTVTDGALSCEFGTQVVFKTSDGTVYAVNSAAQAAKEWEDINPIRANDPKNPGKKLPLDDLIASGQALC
jgi:hypothetical protein